MAVEIVMPRLGWTMETGSIAEWVKKDGDSVQQGDVIFTVESDKAVNEIEAFDSGILRILPNAPDIGESVPIGTPLALLLQPGENPPFAPSASAQTAGIAAPESTPPHSPETGLDTPANGTPSADPNRHAMPTISPRARRVSGELGVAWQNIMGTGHTGRIVERDIRAAAEYAAAHVESPAEVVRVSPVARRVAEDLKVDLGSLAAAMPGQRIERAHVEQAAVTHVEAVPPVDSTDESHRPMSAMRRVIASRMANSAHTTAPVTLTTEVDATDLVALRKQLKSDAAATNRLTPSYNDLLMKLVAEALIEFPALNARLEGDSIVQSEAVHIGLAVHAERGLYVPVIRDVHMKSVRQIARESEALIARARSGSLSSAEMSGGTFSLSNLGMYGIDAFTPIINLPECAILGVGRIVPKPVVIDAEAEKVAIRQMLFLSLTFDHRVVDGAPAAQFLQRVTQFIEHPRLGLL